VKKLKEMQQKENEETAALEKMVHMVEKNLELTTVRIKTRLLTFFSNSISVALEGR
jgi:thioredoxin-like negative regulator of GroEL